MPPWLGISHQRIARGRMLRGRVLRGLALAGFGAGPDRADQLAGVGALRFLGTADEDSLIPGRLVRVNRGGLVAEVLLRSLGRFFFILLGEGKVDAVDPADGGADAVVEFELGVGVPSGFVPKGASSVQPWKCGREVADRRLFKATAAESRRRPAEVRVRLKAQ